MWIVCVCARAVCGREHGQRVDLQRLKGHLNNGNMSRLPQLPPLQNKFQNYFRGVDSVLDVR